MSSVVSPQAASAALIRRAIAGAGDPEKLSPQFLGMLAMLSDAAALLEATAPPANEMPRGQWDEMEPRAKARFLAGGGTFTE